MSVTVCLKCEVNLNKIKSLIDRQIFMINNLRELIYLIVKLDSKINTINSQLKYKDAATNFKEINDLKSTEILLKRKIQKYIEAFKTKIDKNYLEQKIFGSKLEIIEKHHIQNKVWKI